MLRWLGIIGPAVLAVTLLACSDDGGPQPGYSARAVWEVLGGASPDRQAIQKLQQCGGPPVGTECAVQAMRDGGASAEAITFFRETGWFLVRFREMGAVDVGTVVLPWRANANQQYYLMNGQPPLVSPEEEGARLSFSQDPDYQRLTDAVAAAGSGPSPVQLAIFAADNVYESSAARAEGGKRFAFQYNVVNVCHACGTGYMERVALDFDGQGRYLGISLIGLCRVSQAPFQLGGVDACPATSP